MAWGAGVALLAWGSANSIMVNANARWTMTLAWKDLIAGIVNSMIACAYASGNVPIYWVSAFLVCSFLFIDKVNEDPTMLHQQAVLIREAPVPLELTMRRVTYSGTVQMLGGMFVVDIATRGAASASTYPGAVMLAAQRLAPKDMTIAAITMVEGQKPLPSDLRMPDIMSHARYRRLSATPAT